MAAPVYATDLAVFDDAESATGWVEVTGYTTGGTPEDDIDYFIYGTNQCVTQENRKTGLASIAFTGTAVTLPTSGVFLIWEKFLAPNALATEANGGMRLLVGSSSANFYGWKILGSDSYPYGGWVNLAIDPTIGSPDYTTGSPAGTYACMGIGLSLVNAISKGNPHGCDIIRYGRGESRYTVGDATTPALFSGFATANDAITARWGLFQDVGGNYLFKGLMSLGLSATAVYMDDANINITIDNTKKVSAAFNAIEVHNASSVVYWDTVFFTSLCTVSRGTFEVVDNADVQLTNCSFTDLGTFDFLSNSILTTTTFRSCDLITQGGATFTGCIFEASNNTEALLVDDLSLITGCNFISDGTGHGVDLGTVTSTQSMTWDNTDTGYTAASSGDETILVSVASGITLTINVSATGSTPSVYNTGLGTVNVVAGLKTFSFQTSPALIDYEWRIYYVTAVGSMDGAIEKEGQEDATAGAKTHSYSYVADQPIAVQIISQPDHDYVESTTYYTLKNADQSVTINLQKDINN